MRRVVLIFLVIFHRALPSPTPRTEEEKEDRRIRPTPSQHTETRIENHTPLDIIDTAVLDVDPQVWEGENRPDKKINNITINRYGSDQRRYQVSKFARRATWGLALSFEDGSSDYFNINQKYAVGDEAHFKHDTSPDSFFIIDYWKEGGSTLVIRIEFTEYRKNLPTNLMNEAKMFFDESKYQQAEDKIQEALKRAFTDTQMQEIWKLQYEIYKDYGRSLYSHGVNQLSTKNFARAPAYFKEAQSKLLRAQDIQENPEVKLHLTLIDHLI